MSFFNKMLFCLVVELELVVSCFSPCVPAERRLLQPSDCAYSESLTPQGRLVACRRDLTEILVRANFAVSL